MRRESCFQLEPGFLSLRHYTVEAERAAERKAIGKGGAG